MTTQDYVIAGHRVRIEGERLVPAVRHIRGFKPFEAETEGEPICYFREEELENIPPMEQVLYHSEADGFEGDFGRCRGGFLQEMHTPDSPSIFLWVTEGGREARMAGCYTDYLLTFACWGAFGIATVGMDTLLIHTSAICYRDRAVLFLGESGTGKSTHTRLWREHIEGATLLNDDCPVIRIEPDGVWAYGSPWSGKTPCYKNERHPVAACVRLSQAPHNQIRRLRVAQAFGALHPSCPPRFAYDEGLYDQEVGAISKMLSQVPVYHLECLPDEAAARLSCQTVFGV